MSTYGGNDFVPTYRHALTCNVVFRRDISIARNMGLGVLASSEQAHAVIQINSSSWRLSPSRVRLTWHRMLLTKAGASNGLTM